MRTHDDVLVRLQRSIGGYGWTFSADAWQSVASLLESTKDRPNVPYPWESLHAPAGFVRIIAYGSLMNRASAARTIRELDGCEPTPALAFGAKRVYEYKMPESLLKRYGGAPPPEHSAALNVARTGRISDFFNGVLLRIPVESIPALREREAGYDLVELPCLPCMTSSREPTLAYALSSPAEAGWTFRSILPHLDYHDVCYRGAAAWSPQFGECFLDTSYTAHGESSRRYSEAPPPNRDAEPRAGE